MRCRTALVVCACAGAAGAQPDVVECQWALNRQTGISNPWTLAYNPLDDSVYVGVRDTGSDGLYRIAPDGTVTKVVAADRPGGVGVDPVTGAAFIAEDYGGNIYRVELGATERTLWVSGFRSGDDDPVGIAFVPRTYTGSVVPPGAGLSCDRGYSGGYDDVWAWSPDVAEGERLLHADDGTLLNAVEIAVNDARVIVLDDRDDPGALWEVTDASGTLTEVETSTDIARPMAAVFDPTGRDLLVASAGTPKKIVRVSFARDVGEVTDVIVGFVSMGWGSIDVRPDGQALYIADVGADVVYEFVRVGPCPPDFNGDCDVNTLDVLAFLNAWTAGDPAADFNGDGSIDTRDVLAFLNAWNQGC